MAGKLLLSWGITMVPRVNVLVSLICQQMVDNGTLGSTPMPQHEMDMGTGSGNQPGSDYSSGSHNSSSPDSNICSAPQVLAGVAFLSTYRDLITGILGAVMSFYLGKLSDRIGRVKVMALNGHGLLAGELVFFLVVAFPRTIDYHWLFLSFAVDGLSGSFPLLMASTASYVADTTTDNDRIVAMGWLQSGMFLGMALGPAIGTALSQLTPDRPAAVFLWAIICHIVGLLCLLLLPESRKDVHDVQMAPINPEFDELDHSTHKHHDHHHHMYLNHARGHNHGHLAPSPGQSLGSFLRSTLSLAAVDSLFDSSSDHATVRRHRRNLFLLLAVTSIMFGCSVGSMDVLMIYPQAQFQWSMMTTGNFISIVNIFRTVSSTLFLQLLMKFLTSRFRSAFAKKASLNSQVSPPDSQLAEAAQATQLPLLRLALFSDLLGFIGFGLAPSGFLFTAAGVLSSLSALSVSATQAAMTILVLPEHVGKLMGHGWVSAGADSAGSTAGCEPGVRMDRVDVAAGCILRLGGSHWSWSGDDLIS
ncbi:tetracycline-efflux transporter [Grosmannia clavigera kw1407]|uniref:Tetracycline-efflux transporter n=1 Tax=Grosmannia clavigera (strain kw1407 / UAMH 11150) TaxID=655863 RepID=F0XH45_GROCL|nr:tetracycline-efflux transporter [Grosmannia clavigera kw1407]EFX03238.1 tetracycline-efflux transporter [Grosmannia clavigera kw1407]